MLCLVVRDAYQREEARELRVALRELFDGVTWDTVGVYLFWDPETRDILYIGKDSKLSVRFADHNGLSHRSRPGDKRQEVDFWFSNHAALGFSVVGQSAAAHVPGEDSASRAEGQLLETYRLLMDTLPPWNRMGGATVGRRHARPRESILDLATGPLNSLLVARLTIRELAARTDAQRHEATIHHARLLSSFEAGLSTNPAVSDQDIRRWLTKLVAEPDKYGATMDDHIALATSGYLLLTAPFSS
ncbi:MAG: hypothetical protein WD651_01525 [Acidimicrobiia bacterium]